MLRALERGRARCHGRGTQEQRRIECSQHFRSRSESSRVLSWARRVHTRESADKHKRCRETKYHCPVHSQLHESEMDRGAVAARALALKREVRADGQDLPHRANNPDDQERLQL